MGRNNYFRFKQFTILQERSAMKVGVDSVMLGAWAGVSNARSVLDVGTGTGLIALMMAQRTSALITAVEIDASACREARENIAASPWHDRIRIIHASFQDYASAAPETFDHIITNPPYFTNSARPADPRRRTARHNDTLLLHELIDGSIRLMATEGKLSLILPDDTADAFIRLAADKGLCLIRTTRIRHSADKPTRRRLLEFSMAYGPAGETELIIAGATGYSEDYKNLTREFYPAF